MIKDLSKLGYRHKEFLAWLVGFYGYHITSISLRDIGERTGKSHQTISNYLRTLQLNELLSADYVSKRKTEYFVNIRKFDELIRRKRGL